MSSEPTTEAGKRLVAELGSGAHRRDREWPEVAIAAIEAEADAAYRADLEAKVRALPGTGQRGVSNGHVTVWADVDRISRAAVLRLLTDGAEPPKQEGAK